jgi:transcriptional regulator with XRE-family HTH domain
MTSIVELLEHDFPNSTKVQICRAALGLSQKELSLMCNLTQAQVSNFEANKTKHISLSVFNKMVEAMKRYERKLDRKRFRQESVSLEYEE